MVQSYLILLKMGKCELSEISSLSHGPITASNINSKVTKSYMLYVFK